MLNINTLLTGHLLHNQDVYKQINWELRDAVIKDYKTGNIVFEQKNCEFPDFYSDTAVNVIASKYFKGQLGTPQRETSLRQLIDRVVTTIRKWGYEQDYFDLENANKFEQELRYILVHQLAAFNSPVWFNVGVTWDANRGWCYDPKSNSARPIQGRGLSFNKGEHKPQASACFILGVEDSMEDILDWYKNEGLIFKFGSGSGVNLSKIRSTKEFVRGGGRPSGPVSFMRAADISASTIKSGGKHRRAAKMVILNADHPDIEEFIECKVKEEEKAQSLIAAGYDPNFNVAGGAYDSVFYQNANHSVRVNNRFMQAALDKKPYSLYGQDGTKVGTKQADEVLGKISMAAWRCADPGIQFHDTTNLWNVCANEEDIVASNPCSEYVFLDDTACNLASINLMKFRKSSTNRFGFDVEKFEHVCRILITAQDILVDNAGYPTAKIAWRSHLYRTLGLGYANLGALLMSYGVPYDSEEGRQVAASITALMTAAAYNQSMVIAHYLSPFARFGNNSSSCMKVMQMHRDQAHQLLTDSPIAERAKTLFRSNANDGNKTGFRNAQVTVIAPTGTIGFMMDCDTTGIEPELSLVKYKKLVGGGDLKLVNQTVGLALDELKYSREQKKVMLSKMEASEDFSHLIHAEHVPVFDTSFPHPGTGRSIHYMGHIKMMAAVQPFLSGAISKTVNMPHESTVEDIQNAYIEAWKLGLKCIAIYRDGSKGSQPLSVKADDKQETKVIEKITVVEKEVPVGLRKKLPDTRSSVTHRFQIGPHDGYFTVGLYEDGTPGELFINMAKEGSTISGLMDWAGIMTSMALQWGTPLDVIIGKLKGMQFEPSGFSQHQDIRFARSVADYLARWLEVEFLHKQQSLDLGIPIPVSKMNDNVTMEEVKVPGTQKAPGNLSLPPCPNCGSLMVPNGSCHKCTNCGETSGCS